MSEQQVQDNSAVYYERRYSGWGLRYHKEVISWMMEGIWADQKVLDAGCGTGIISRLYPSYLVYGVDISPEMIARTPLRMVAVQETVCEHGNVAPSPFLRLSCIADVTNLSPQMSGTLDAVVCRSLLHHLPDHNKALREFSRVLKPNGRLVCWETNKGWLAQKVRAKTQHGDRFSEYHHAFRAGELEWDITQAGFRIDEVRYMGFLGYPLWGFPDIIDLSRWVPFKPVVYQVTRGVDYLLEHTPVLNKMSWAIGIKAHKVGVESYD